MGSCAFSKSSKLPKRLKVLPKQTAISPNVKPRVEQASGRTVNRKIGMGDKRWKRRAGRDCNFCQFARQGSACQCWSQWKPRRYNSPSKIYFQRHFCKICKAKVSSVSWQRVHSVSLDASIVKGHYVDCYLTLRCKLQNLWGESREKEKSTLHTWG